MIWKLNDDFIVAERIKCSKSFVFNIGMQFIIASVTSGSIHLFDECDIQMLKDFFQLSMEKYWK